MAHAGASAMVPGSTARNQELFTDSTIGTPWKIWIDKDVPNRSNLVAEVQAHGGSVVKDASNAALLLVDPHLTTSTSLESIRSAKERPILLDAKWAWTCIAQNVIGEHYGHKGNWGGFKMDMPTRDERGRIFFPMQRQPSIELPSTSREPSFEPASPSGPDDDETAQASQDSYLEQATQETQDGRNPFKIEHHPNGSHFFLAPNTSSFPFPQPVILDDSTPYPSFAAISGAWGSNHDHNHFDPSGHEAGGRASQDLLSHWDDHGRSLQGSQAFLHTSSFGLPNTQESFALLFPTVSVPSLVTSDAQPPSLGSAQHQQQHQSSDPNHEAAIEAERSDLCSVSSESAESAQGQGPIQSSSQTRKRKRPRDEDGLTQPSSKRSSTGQSGSVEGGLDAASLSTLASAEPASFMSPLESAYPPRPASRVRSRSPTPPTSVVAAHGGKLFTDEDVAYLHNYIQYVKETNQMLSLKEICERLAVKAPHHSFYSWRRYCNKHRIQIGAYSTEAAMSSTADSDAYHSDGRSPPFGPPSPSSTSPTDLGEDPSINHLPVPASAIDTGCHQSTILVALSPSPMLRYRLSSTSSDNSPSPPSFIQTTMPSPPKVLERSKTGKGIAFTRTDVDFLLQYMSYQRYQLSIKNNVNQSDGEDSKDEVNMAQFWNDMCKLVPHHSRASWVKYWRRHAADLEFDPSAPVSPPESNPNSGGSVYGTGKPSKPSRPNSSSTDTKRSRYTKEDDLLLAQYMSNHSSSSILALGPSPQATTASSITSALKSSAVALSLEQLFRQFALLYPHHPAKGWLERYRTHKAEIDVLISQLQSPQNHELSH